MRVRVPRMCARIPVFGARALPGLRSGRIRSFAPFRVLRVERAGGGPRIVVIEARALEDDADRVEELAERAAARFADLQRLVRKRLANVKLVAALGAAIRIGGHEGPPARANFIRGPRLLRGAVARHAVRFRGRCTVCMEKGVDRRRSSHRANKGRRPPNGEPTPLRRYGTRALRVIST